MVAPVVSPLVIRSGEAMPVLMRSIGDEIRAWEKGVRSEEEALASIRQLFRANGLLQPREAPGHAPPPRLRVRLRARP